MMSMPEQKKDNATLYKRTGSLAQCTYTGLFVRNAVQSMFAWSILVHK